MTVPAAIVPGDGSRTLGVTISSIAFLVDDFDAPELVPLQQAFLDGAHFIYGHTVMQRAFGLGYGSKWAASHLPARAERNAFYTAVGERVLPGKRGQETLRQLNPAHQTPAQILESLGDAIA